LTLGDGRGFGGSGPRKKTQKREREDPQTLHAPSGGKRGGRNSFMKGRNPHEKKGILKKEGIDHSGDEMEELAVRAGRT